MFYSIVLYCTLLYCTVLYCIVLYSTLFHSILLYCVVLHRTLLYSTLTYSTVLIASTRLRATNVTNNITLFESLRQESDEFTRKETEIHLCLCTQVVFMYLKYTFVETHRISIGVHSILKLIIHFSFISQRLLFLTASSWVLLS